VRGVFRSVQSQVARRLGQVAGDRQLADGVLVVSLISVDERERIIDALTAGESQNGVAKKFGRGPATVNRIARENGLEYSSPKKAVEARVDYSGERRVELLNAAFAKAEEMLENIDRPSQLMQWAIALGTLTDKRRLEDGEATSRSEVTNVDNPRKRIAGKLVELRERRAARAVAS
jgi:hypothetical protein